MVNSEALLRRLEAVRAQIASACEKCGRPLESVRLLGVTKTLAAEQIAPAIAAGLEDCGENYLQELRTKVSQLPPVHWHFIGHLQRNKAGAAVACVDYIHSLDSLALIRAVDRHCVELQRDVKGLLEVRLGGENTKTGLALEEVEPLLTALEQEPLQRLRLVGLMTVPPPVELPEDNRQYFRQLRELLHEIQTHRYEFWRGSELSMGMSDDYLVAIEEGATMVRVGRAIFGERPPKVKT